MENRGRIGARDFQRNESRSKTQEAGRLFAVPASAAIETVAGLPGNLEQLLLAGSRLLNNANKRSVPHLNSLYKVQGEIPKSVTGLPNSSDVHEFLNKVAEPALGKRSLDPENSFENLIARALPEAALLALTGGGSTGYNLGRSFLSNAAGMAGGALGQSLGGNTGELLGDIAGHLGTGYAHDLYKAGATKGAVRTRYEKNNPEVLNRAFKEAKDTGYKAHTILEERDKIIDKINSGFAGIPASKNKSIIKQIEQSTQHIYDAQPQINKIEKELESLHALKNKRSKLDPKLHLDEKIMAAQVKLEKELAHHGTAKTEDILKSRINLNNIIKEMPEGKEKDLLKGVSQSFTDSLKGESYEQAIKGSGRKLSTPTQENIKQTPAAFGELLNKHDETYKALNVFGPKDKTASNIHGKVIKIDPTKKNIAGPAMKFLERNTDLAKVAKNGLSKAATVGGSAGAGAILGGLSGAAIGAGGAAATGLGYQAMLTAFKSVLKNKNFYDNLPEAAELLKDLKAAVKANQPKRFANTLGRLTSQANALYNPPIKKIESNEKNGLKPAVYR